MVDLQYMKSPDFKPYEENRPWGSFLRFTENEASTVKILVIDPGEAFSLQYHHHREEVWHVLTGDGTITIGKTQLPIQAGDTHVIPPETLHRVRAGDSTVSILEISFGEFDETDIVRIEDEYGRI
jgi:mannose-6-phosphate isomerase-like protein (cupin superfamily)